MDIVQIQNKINKLILNGDNIIKHSDIVLTYSDEMHSIESICEKARKVSASIQRIDKLLLIETVGARGGNHSLAILVIMPYETVNLSGNSINAAVYHFNELGIYTDIAKKLGITGNELRNLLYQGKIHISNSVNMKQIKINIIGSIDCNTSTISCNKHINMEDIKHNKKLRVYCIDEF